MASTEHIDTHNTESFEDEYGVEHIMVREFEGVEYHIHVSIINNVGGMVGIYKNNYSYTYALMELPPNKEIFNAMVYSIISQGKQQKVLFN